MLFNQFRGLLVDYVHPRKFPVLGVASKLALSATTIAVLVGVYQFNTNDIGKNSGFFFRSSSSSEIPFYHRTHGIHRESVGSIVLRLYPACTMFVPQ